MNNTTTMNQVSERVYAMSKNCFDKNITVKDISFDDLKTIRIGEYETHPMREIAQRSISWRLGIPYQYLQKCPPEIQAVNMNHWLAHEKNDQLFCRFDGDDVRAIFTPKYRPVDNFEVLERLDSLGYGPDTKVQCKLDHDLMLLSIPDGNKTFEINGDKITPGVSIANSEVGLSALSIEAFMLRLVCTNGLISKTQIGASYRHISIKILTEFPDVLEKVSYELGRQKHQFQLSMESLVDNPSNTLERFNRQFQLNKPEKEAVDWGWLLEAGNTMFNVVNTYTRAAQFETLPAESAYRLQKVGGNILGMLN